MIEKGLKRKLAAILSADVEGYSRLIGDDEVATIRTLMEYKGAMSTIIQQHRGLVVDAPGDNMLAEFASVVDAVQCAVKIQRELAKFNTELPRSCRMQFRIGINLGDVVEDENRIYGEGVNIAARIESLADAGGICISRTSFEQVENKLDFEFEDIGKHKLKNILRPVQIYRVLSNQEIPIPCDSPVEKEILADDLADPALNHLPDASLAVLPFANMSRDVDQEYFIDGITEDLITDLSKVPGLFVIARHSSFVYKNMAHNIKSIGKELGVRYLLEGSVRRVGNRVRITGQLIDAASGGHLWADRFDRDLKDIFEVQDEVVGRIVTNLADKLPIKSIKKVPRLFPNELEAYELTMKGRQCVYENYSRKESKVALKRAIEIDPDYAPAYAWLAVWYYSNWAFYNTEDPNTSIDEAFAAAHKAVELEPENNLSHMALGIVSLYGGRCHEALIEFQKSLDLNPNDADVLTFLQEALTFNGRPMEAVASVRKAMRLNPHYPEWYVWHLGFAYYAAYRYQEAVAELSKLKVMKEPLRILAAAFAMVGRMGEARATTQEFLKHNPRFSIRQWAASQPFKADEDRQHFIDGYLKAGLSM